MRESNRFFMHVYFDIKYTIIFLIGFNRNIVDVTHLSLRVARPFVLFGRDIAKCIAIASFGVVPDAVFAKCQQSRCVVTDYYNLPAAAGTASAAAPSAEATETSASGESTASASEASAKAASEIGNAAQATAAARAEDQVHRQDHQDQEDNGVLLHPVAFRLPVTFLPGIVFAFGSLHERLYAIKEALVVLAFLKIGNDIVFTDVFGLKIGDGAFQAIAHGNEELALSFAAGGLHKDYHAIVVFAATDSPVVEDLC